MSGQVLPRGSTPTTRLGFGGAYLTAGWEMRSSCRLVDVAFDAGLRHFDVAPCYGMGTAETVVGEALKKRRHEVTIASKVGLPRGRLTAKAQALRFVALPIRKLGLSSRLRRNIQPTSQPVVGNFSLAFVEQSLRETLQCLKTDYLDLLLLHEVHLESLTDELVTLLDKARTDGVVRSIGIATSRAQTEAIAASGYANVWDVYQYSWCVADAKLPDFQATKFHITHRAIMNGLPVLKLKFHQDPGFRDRISELCGFDLASDIELSRVLLGAAMAHRQEGIVLFASRRPHRVRDGAVVLHDPRYIDAGKLLASSISAG